MIMSKTAQKGLGPKPRCLKIQELRQVHLRRDKCKYGAHFRVRIKKSNTCPNFQVSKVKTCITFLDSNPKMCIRSLLGIVCITFLDSDPKMCIGSLLGFGCTYTLDSLMRQVHRPPINAMASASFFSDLLIPGLGFSERVGSN